MPTNIALSDVAGHRASVALPAVPGQHLAASLRRRGAGIVLCILIGGGAVLSATVALRLPAAGDAIEALASVAGF